MKRTGVLLLALFTCLAFSAWGQGNEKQTLFEDNFNSGTWKPEWQSIMCCQWVQDGWLYTQETSGWPRDSMAVVHDADQNWKDYTLSLKAQFVQTPNYYDVNDFTILVRTVNFVRSSAQHSGKAYQIIFNGKGYDWTPNQVVLIRSDYDTGSDTTLVTKDFPLSLNPMNLKITVKGPRIQLWIDGKKVFDVTDPSPLLYGGIGVHAIWETSARFDDVAVVSTNAQYNFTSLDCPGAERTRTHGINNNGDIVGSCKYPGDVMHAVLIRKGKFIPLAPTTVLGTNFSVAYKINGHGDIVGIFIGDDGYYHGFLLRKGALTILDFPGANETFATGINQSGTVVGWWNTYDVYGNIVSSGGFTWNNGNFNEVEFPGGGSTAVVGINDRGDLVGDWAPDPNGSVAHGLLFTQAQEQFTSFDVPFPGAIVTQGDDINNSGYIVGLYIDDSGIEHGFLKTGAAFNSIDYPGAVGLTSAWGINSAGQMVGVWVDNSGARHGWLAQPGSKGKPPYTPAEGVGNIPSKVDRPAHGKRVSPILD